MAGMLEKRFGNPREALSCYSRLVVGYASDRWAEFARMEMERLKRMNPCAAAVDKK
jgi:hypothetical protein